MDERYLIGIIFAITSGIIFNIGSLLQKLAVSSGAGGAGMMGRLTKNPQWLLGFALQIVVGTPLNMLALSMIGPVIIPGLSSIGLVVLAIGAVRHAGETFHTGEIVGIGLVIAAVALFGLSGMAVDLRTIGIYETAFLLRLCAYSAVLTTFSLVCHAAQKKIPHLSGVLRTLNAGLLFAQSNLWLGVLTELLSRWFKDHFALTHFPLILLTSAVVLVASMLGITETQRAFEAGEASKLIPIQNVPSQIFPVVAYFTVFLLKPTDARSLPLTLLGVALVLAGAFLLAGRQMTSKTTQAEKTDPN
jgi:hypothetical protein